MKKAITITGALASILLVVGFAAAHDIWLLPNRFVLERGDTLVVRQLAGSELDPEHHLGLLRTMTPRFELITPDGSEDLLASLPTMKERPEIRPVLRRVVDFDGLALVAMEHDFIWTEFTSAEFADYVEHEQQEIADLHGHEHQVEGRDATVTERYARTLKTLIQVGQTARGDLHRRVLGHKLEILLLQNPYLLGPGDELDVKILFKGMPLIDQVVAAFSGGGGELVAKSTARTDRHGVARFQLTRPGTWLVRLVHMIPCEEHPEVDCDDVAWESYWSSFSFGLG